MSIASRIESMTTHLQNDYDALESVVGTITEDKNIENIAPILENLWETLPKSTGTGTSLSLATKAGKMKLDLYGNTSQVSLSGKNLVDTSIDQLKTRNIDGTWNNDVYTMNGIVFTPIYENGLLQYINVNGTSSDEANFFFGPFTTTNTTTSYTLTGCPSGGSSTTYRLWCDYMGGDTGNGITGVINYVGRIISRINIKSGTSISNLKFYPMVRLSSITDDTYEPYCGGTASPNPSYPQTIHSVSGDNTIKECGANLFHISNFSKSGWNITIDNPLKGLSAGKYSISCVNPSSTGKGYAIVFNNNPTGGATGMIGGYLTGYDFGKDRYSYENRDVTQDQINADYIIFLGSDNAGTQQVLEDMQIMLNSGATSLPYDPYTSTSYSVNLGVENFIDYSSLSNQQYITTEGDYITITNNSGAAIYPTITFSTPLAIGNYTSRVEVVSITSGKTFFIYSQENNSDYTAEHTVSFNTATTKVVTQTFTDTFKKYMMVVPDGCTVKLSAMVVKGTYSSQQIWSYTPYGVTPIEMYEIGTYKDRFFKNIPNTTDYNSNLEDNEWYLEKKIKKVVLDGNTNWDLVSINTYNIANFALSGGLADYIGGTINLALTNYFSAQTTLGSNTQTPGFYLNQAKEFYLRIESSTASTSAELKAWFSSNNTNLCYVVATPTYTPITGTLKDELETAWRAYSYKDTTNISQVNYDLPFNLDITALEG